MAKLINPARTKKGMFLLLDDDNHDDGDNNEDDINKDAQERTRYYDVAKPAISNFPRIGTHFFCDSCKLG